eukprot:TRINITY_DN3846_c0_g1_i1.p1 TRINITY_DN3846_c0_g1~~TRINITY_DN3846_c0_g1_i1.p1  ORF type:complete len:209 (-),score=46.32 TRINITY_DN3846_c0_g1_i1:729-1355(-)
MPEYNFKIVLLGEGRVGKTSLVLRYCQNTYSDKTTSTVQASYLTKKLTIGENRVNLAIWDTAGQERYHALGPIYYRDANAALLVYDMTDPDSFSKVKNWVKELRTMLGKNVVLAIAGNKADLEKSRQVSNEDGMTYALTVSASHFNTSAKNNKNVDEVFLDLTKRMIENAKQNPVGNLGGSTSAMPKRTGVQIESTPSASSGSGGGCC